MMMPTTRARAPKADERARMIEVYHKAAHIFQEKGFEATSMSDLAEALQITKAGLYYYIKSKQELLFDIVSHAMDCLEQEVSTPALAEPDPEKRLIHSHSHRRGLCSIAQVPPANPGPKTRLLRSGSEHAR
jgi:AcrR family transcriptional regulator